MEPMPPLDRQAFLEALRQHTEESLGQAAEAVHDASDGHIINASGEKIRDLFTDLRLRAFQTALQRRIGVAQAAFSHSKRYPDRKVLAQ
ncbi:MAG: hypothetical protein ACFCD0_18395 [Gemmataceae bacterium]